LYSQDSTKNTDLSGMVAYQQSKTVVKLETVMRQQILDSDPDQKSFADLLPRLRTGDCTIADWKHLMKRKPTAYNLNNFKDAIRLFS